MDDSKIFGAAITVFVLIIGVPWARHSLRRLFLVAVVLGIAGGLRIGTATGGIYPYELLVVICGMFLMANRSVTPPPRLTRRAALGFGMLAVWWVAGALINVLILKPDLHLMVSMGIATDALQLKLLGHLGITILVCGIAFWAGGVLFNPDFDTKLVFSSVICGTTIVSLATLIEWIKSTGGVLSRYNFIPPTDLGHGGTSFIVLIGAACCLLLWLASGGRRLILSGLLLLHCLVILVVQTRQGYVTALFYFAVLTPLCGALLLNRRRKVGLLVAAPFVIVIVAGVLGQVLVRSGFYQSFTSLTNADVEDRTNKARLNGAAEDIFMVHPLIGVGRGQFAIYSDVPMVVTGQNVYVATPHNGFFELLAETGLPGTLLAYALEIWLCWRLWLIYRGIYSPLTRAVGGMTAFLVTVSAATSIIQSNSLFPTPDQRDFVREAFLIWFLAGFAAGARLPEQSGENEEATDEVPFTADAGHLWEEQC
jgi:O-antigen ligase